MSCVMRILRWTRNTVITLLVLFVIVVGVSLFVMSGAETIGELYAQRSAPDRTGAACLSNQSCVVADHAPIGGLAEYRRCGGVVASSRLKGQPLACTGRLATDILLRDWFNPGQSAYRQLRRGCRAHDLCYVHGRATYGLDQSHCDREFLAENLRECWLIYGNENESPWLRDRDMLRLGCQIRASVAYLVVRALGKGYFERQEGIACDHEGGPHAARDQVVSGRFLGGTRDYMIALSQARDRDALVVRLLSFGPDGQSTDVTEPAVVSPDRVLIGDRDWACQRRRMADGGFSADCPEWLGQSAHTSAADWLRFSPVVVDSDGDHADELIIPSLTPDFGLVFTHIRAKRTGRVVSFEPPRAYLGVARVATAKATEGGCEDQLEFADCTGSGKTAAAQLLSSEAATQNSGYRFSVAASADGACFPEGQPAKQDVLLFSAFSDFPENPSEFVAEKGGWDSGFVLRRFLFDSKAQRWLMRRDRFNNDWHRMSGCTMRLSRDEFQTHARLQHPPFVVRMPAKEATEGKPPACVIPDERLALITRDKCPTSTPVARAGSLNDVDLMLYQLQPSTKYMLASDKEKRKKFKRWHGYDELRMAEVHWKPIQWAESTDPAFTSRSARANGIVMASAFVGGTATIGGRKKDVKREGHHPIVAVLRDDQLKKLTYRDYHRYADTMGHVPDLYGVFKSSRFGKSTSERVTNVWDPHRYGPAKIYFQIPSLLAPFTARGGRGDSVVFFSNSNLWEQAGDPAPEHKSERLPIASGWFRVLIVPIPADGPYASPGMFDCPVSAISGAEVEPAVGASGPEKFLHRQPVLAGRFLDTDKGGSLAVAWRDVSGEIRLTALHFAQGTWKFGSKACMRPAGMDEDELYRHRIN